MNRKTRQREKEAVANPQVRLALQRATRSSSLGHAAAVASIDWEGLRKELRSIKEESIEGLPEMVQQFRNEAEKAGAVVHEAQDGGAARAYALELARSRGVKLAVKSKSMLTEEIELNHHLETAGVQVVETDLGEWIIQLAGERPSHFVGPAIHKTREEIARLFSQKLGQEVPPDPPVMTRLARQKLRQYFIDADLGISGANMALAETGSLVIVSNEGNARLTTTLPPVHLAFVGYEKIIPGLRESAVVLELLSRSAGGSKMTAYVSYITGPSRTMDIEKTLVWGVHGPEEVHIVLVDNGRLALREAPDFREALYCIKCGACLNVCPIFQVVGGHVFGEVYHGGIGAILTAFLQGRDVRSHVSTQKAEDITRLCIGCGKCLEACPVMIDIPRMVRTLKERIAAKKGLPWAKSMLYRHVLPHRDRFRRALAGAEVLPGFLTPYPRGGTRPSPAPSPFHSSRTPISPDEPVERVGFYAGCMLDLVQPEMARAIVEALARRGVESVYPREEVCCGGPAIFDGDAEAGRMMAQRNIACLEEIEAGTILVACPSCSLVMKREYPRLFAGNAEWLPRAQALAARVKDFSAYLAGLGQGQEDAALQPLTVTYHDSCHLKRELGIHLEPRRLLREAGHELVEMEDADRCCGYGGTYSLEHPEISGALVEQKLDAIEATGAQVVACDCPGCLLHISEGLRRRGSQVRALHTAQLLL